MARVILFDVNETLLDMSMLAPHFERAFGRARAREEWFQQLRENWNVATLTGRFTESATLADAALRMTAAREEVTVSDEDRSAILGGMRRLPPHPDVEPALRMLRDAGMPLAALTNGGPDTAREQLEHAGLTAFFDAILSAEETGRYKPAPESYRVAAERLGKKPADVRMVAAHAWDLAGAAAAGCATAFVARPRQVLNPAGPQPDLEADDLLRLAERMLTLDGPG